MRMHTRRSTRFTNVFSRNWRINIAVISLHLCLITFAGFTKRRGFTPAMAAGVTDRAWDVEAIVRLLEAEKAEQAKWSKTHYGSALGQEPLG